MKTLAVLASLLFLTAQSPAKVLIFKGTIRTKSDTSTAFPKFFNLFQVFDPDTSVTATVATFQKDTKKLQLPALPSDIRFAQAPLPDGKSTTTISLVIENGASNEFFQNAGLHFRGVNKALRFSSAFVGNSVSFPRLIAGTLFNDQAFNGDGSFVEQKILLTYQESRTIAANDANQTVQQVIDSLVAELKIKGFEAPAP
jgi:hypothetical protein